MNLLIYQVKMIYHFQAFGFLASVPYGSEVCWKCWNYMFKKKFQSSDELTN